MRFYIGLFLLIPVFALAGQISPASSKPLRGMSQPCISPDGTMVAFQYRSDIWVVGSEGGIARRLTNNVELDWRPFWSPDGRWVGFTSDRNGNSDVFAAPVDGGEVRQITYSGGGEAGTSWSPDGRWILFSGRRDRPFTGIFAIDVADLRFRLVADDYQGLSEGRFSPDGKTIVAQKYGFPWTRPRYFGSAASQIVLIDFATGIQRPLVNNERQNLWPFFSPDGKHVYAVTYGEVTPSSRNINEAASKFVDNANRTPNLWKFDMNGRGQRVTSFVGEPVRHPSMSTNGVICFEKEGEIFILKNNESKRLDIRATIDVRFNTLQRIVYTGDATEAVISPDGKTFAFVVGSEIWTVPVEKGEGRNKDDATRLTDYPGVDGEILWSSDGKHLYFISDRDGSRRLYSLQIENKKITPVWTRDDDVQGLKLSPNGIYLAFWVTGAEGGLYIWDTRTSGDFKKVLHQPGVHFWDLSAGQFDWSPDSDWLAATRRQPGGTLNLWVIRLSDREVVQVTRRNVWHGNPAWSPDGKYLYFSSSRDGGGYFILPLQPEDAAPEEIELKYTKPEGSVKVEINFDGIVDRSRRLFSQGVSGNVICDKESGNIYFLVGDNVWVSDYAGKNVRQIIGGGFTMFSITGDGKTLYGLRNGVPVKATLSGNYPVTNISFRAEYLFDEDRVRRAAFTEFWRVYNRGFYDGNFHGRDWHKIRDRYEPLLEGVSHRREFAELLNMMVGELEASHTEVGPAPGGAPNHFGVTLPGFNFDYRYEGPGIRVLELYEEAPGTFKKTEIKPGDYIMQINGVDVRLDEKLWEVLHNQSGRDLVLLVNDKPSKEGARTVKYKSVSPGEWSEMRYREWIRRNRDAVEKATNGRIGYIHIRAMGGGDRQRFQEEFHEYKLGKDAMIIDVRFNGGGNISDSLIDVLERKPHGYYLPRDGWVQTAPSDEVWDKPIVVLHNEHSYSNGEMFPYAMKERKLGLLIGMPTPGYVIWTWGNRLVDGTSIRMPMSGVYRMDGTPMENMGQAPDIRIPWSNEDYMSWKDPQLDRAIQEALKRAPK